MECYKKNLAKISLLGLSLGGILPVQAANPPTTLEEMWEIIQHQQQEIEQLKQQIQTTNQKVEQTEQQVQETDEKVEATSLMVEEGTTTPTWAEKTQLGAYGELHYNNLQNDKVGGNAKKELDYHRFVLFLFTTVHFKKKFINYDIKMIY